MNEKETQEKAMELAHRVATQSGALRFPYRIQDNALRVYVEETTKLILEHIPLTHLLASEAERDDLLAAMKVFFDLGRVVGMTWTESAKQVFERVKKAEEELIHIDETLARRPALADEPTRQSKIEKAINTAKQADQLRAELSETQKQFGLCSVCNKAAWVTRADGKSEDCEVCKLRAELEQARKWLAERPSETLHQNRVEEIGLLKARNALLEQGKELAKKALSEIVNDFRNTGNSQGNYSDGEYTQDYTTRQELVEHALTAYDQAENGGGE